MFSQLRQQLNASQLVRQAATLFGANLATRSLAFIGTAYAARCLGPTNLGISALVLSVVQGLATLSGGGLDVVAVRRIAAEPTAARGLSRKVAKFRGTVLMGVVPIGLAAALWLAPAGQFFAWSMGAVFLVATVFSCTFVFQGLEKLPVQALLSVLTGLLAAAAYLGLFRPGMPAGSDLAVMGVTGLAGAGLGWWMVASVTCRHGRQVEIPTIYNLLKEARPYWILVIVVYCYSTLQIPLVGALAGEKTLGVYRSALMLAAGLDLLYSSLNTLLLPRLVRWREEGMAVLWQRQKQLTAASLAAGLCVAAVAIAVAPIVYSLVLGQRFAGGVIPFQILVLSRTVVFVGQIYTNSLSAFRLDKQLLWASIAGAAFSVIGNIVAVQKFGIIGAAIVSLFAELIVHGICFVYTRLHFRGSRLKPAAFVA